MKYNASERLFMQAGLNLVFRNMVGTMIFLNTSEMPINDSTPILRATQSISVRTLELPVSLGYYILNSKKGKISLMAGYSFNYLFNVKYTDSWTFKKEYWQGNSFLLGAGYIMPINRNANFQAGAMYSIINTVSTDKYIFSQNEPFIDLPHKFLKLNIGLEWEL